MPKRRTKNPGKLKGLNWSVKTMPDGTRVTYYYAYRGGPRLPGAYGSPEFMEAFIQANKRVDQKTVVDGRTLLSLLNAYQASSDFKGLKERTRADYIVQIKKIEVKFSDFPISGMSDKRTRGLFKAWRDKLAEKSLRQADYAFTVLARVLSWSLDRGMIDANPCEKAGRLYKGERSESVWTDADERAFLAKAPQHLHLPFLFGLWTGQREGDILRLTWRQYDGRYIRVEQGKTKARVQVPVGGPLKVALDKLMVERQPQPFDRIVLNSRGEPWTTHGFSSSFRKASAACGIDGLTFHDTRGTAVTRLSIAGATTQQIATFTGHSLRDVQEILDRHYLNRDVTMADDALVKLETRTPISN